MSIETKNIAGETFWLNLAAENIYTTFEKRGKSVTNLKEVIVWAFGLFTASGFVISVFGNSVKNFDLNALWCFGIAFFFLTISYAMAGQAQYPVTKEYHPNDVSDISNAFNKAVKTQSFYFQWAAGIATAGFFFLALGILYLFYTARKEPDVVKVIINPLVLKASIIKKAGKNYLPLTITTTPDTGRVDLSISVIKKGEDTLIYSQPFTTDSSGRISYSYTDTIINKYDSFLVKAQRQQISAGVATERSTSVIVIKNK